MVRCGYVICQKDRLHLGLLTNEKVTTAPIVDNVNYSKKTGNKVV